MGSFLSAGNYEEVKEKHVGERGGIWNWMMDNAQK